jgi:two-component system sensor histidine kinase YesM
MLPAGLRSRLVGLKLYRYPKAPGKNSQIYAQSTAQKFNLEVEALFERVDALYNSLLFNENVESMMQNPYSDKTPTHVNALQAQFSSLHLLNPDLVDIGLITPDMAWSGYFDKKSLKNFSRSMQNTRGTTCFGLQVSSFSKAKDKAEPRLVFGHNVYGMFDRSHYGQYLGSIILVLDLSKSSIRLPQTDRSRTQFFLLDQHGSAFPFNTAPDDYPPISKRVDFSNRPIGPSQTEDYLIYNAPLNDTGLFMVSVMDRHALSEEGLHTITILIGVTLASLILISLLMLLMLQSVVKPLSQLSDYIDKIRRMPLGSEPEPVTLEGCEEITNLSHSFNTMLDEKARLTRDLQEATVNLYESQLDRKQAELDYLRSQINPHFLYNTLEAIQGIALEKEVPEIADASGALGKLLRHNIQGSDMVSLNRELEITEAYLTIQKLRFTDKLNVIISVRENTRKLPVMKLLLQPLVENAVYHGLEPKTGPGTLYIGARIEESDLLISIYDDGVGIPPEKLSELQENLDRDPQSLRSAKVHIGLLNVQNRIRLRYGKPYGISLESTPGKGTKVILRLPVETEKEDGTKEC